MTAISTVGYAVIPGVLDGETLKTLWGPPKPPRRAGLTRGGPGRDRLHRDAGIPGESLERLRAAPPVVTAVAELLSPEPRGSGS